VLRLSHSPQDRQLPPVSQSTLSLTQQQQQHCIAHQRSIGFHQKKATAATRTKRWRETQLKQINGESKNSCSTDWHVAISDAIG
jgi:hypothetical protein